MPRKTTAKKKPAPKKTKAVAKRGSMLPAKTVDFEADAGAGFENADADSFAIPFLVILQKMSPQCDRDSGDHVPGAKPGDLFNTVTRETFSDGVLVVPAFYQRLFVEWVPRDQGGGWKGAYLPGDAIMKKARRDDMGRFVLENGNYLADTRYHFCILVKDDGSFEPILASFTSTQIKKSRGWMTTMDGIKFEGKGGRRFTPPMFSHVYRLTTVSESNDMGTWKGWRIELDRPIGEKEVDFYVAAKALRDNVKTGTATIPTEDPSAESGDVGDEDF